jgi:hypothetical protein
VASSTNKADRHNITEILLKLAVRYMDIELASVLTIFAIVFWSCSDSVILISYLFSTIVLNLFPEHVEFECDP